ncbi:MAG: beta-ketoacyl-[acyl-carrier-protein] synthase family protein [Deltaproteobacteria bacterium]|nr:beta-ketoacyl-[acyl-carrier-protein] synthase family protein [Deltaproteobacteria bacterium]
MSGEENSRRRVAITGMGLVTPFGIGVEKFWQSALSGASGTSRVKHFNASGLPSQTAGYLRDEALCGLGSSPGAFDVGEPRFVQFALMAARMASEGSGWLDWFEPERSGIFMGTSGERVSLSQYAQVVYEARGENGDINLKDFVRVWGRKMQGKFLVRLLPQYATARLAREFGVLGPATTINTACTSSAHAIGEALRAIRRGTVDLAVAGGSECIVSQIGMQIFSLLGVLSRRNDAPEKASRPFDAERDGFVLGEGAGILILESFDLAIKRGAPILAELAGYGTSCDAYRITDEAPDGRGAILAMRSALEDASLSQDDIGYINAHGTSTRMNDLVETRAVKTVFGRRAYEIPMSSTKSMIGHTISAAGAIELITCVLVLRDQIIPPTINYEFPDPDCDLDYVPNQARPAKVETALSNSFGFGGHNDCLVVKRFSP